MCEGLMVILRPKKSTETALRARHMPGEGRETQTTSYHQGKFSEGKKPIGMSFKCGTECGNRWKEMEWSREVQ